MRVHHDVYPRSADEGIFYPEAAGEPRAHLRGRTPGPELASRLGDSGEKYCGRREGREGREGQEGEELHFVLLFTCKIWFYDSWGQVEMRNSLPQAV